MIIEIHSIQSETVFFTAWEIPEYIWNKRKEFICNLFYKYILKYDLKCSQLDWQNSIVFKLCAQEKDFIQMERIFDRYFNSINIVNTVT